MFQIFVSVNGSGHLGFCNRLGLCNHSGLCNTLESMCDTLLTASSSSCAAETRRPLSRPETDSNSRFGSKESTNFGNLSESCSRPAEWKTPFHLRMIKSEFLLKERIKVPKSVLNPINGETLPKSKHIPNFRFCERIWPFGFL